MSRREFSQGLDSEGAAAPAPAEGDAPEPQRGPNTAVSPSEGG